MVEGVGQGKGLVCIHDLPPPEAISGRGCERTVSEPSRREFSGPPSVKRRIGIRNRLVTARALSEQKGSPLFCLRFFSPILQLTLRGTYEMPTAAREPRGMLVAGSLRSPPMLKPAMTPERHPDMG